jgi:ATP-dependent Clp endopeptidase proteolytic subunit ClpP
MRKAILKLYGYLYDVTGLVEQLEQLNGQGYDEIELHIHSEGGDVINGFFLYNKIKESQTPVDVYIDGMAASMASIVMLAGRKIYMSENAFLMLHSPKGSVYGTANEIAQAFKPLKEMERIFINYYSAKTGKTPADVSKYLEGDNWFSAQQAKQEGLIDDIVGNIYVSPSGADDTQGLRPAEMYARYTALANDVKTNSLNKKSMDNATLISNLNLTGITAESTDEQVISAIRAKMEDEKKPLQASIDATVTGMVAAAQKAGKITEAQKANFEAIGKTSGIEALATVLDAIKAYEPIAAKVQTGGASAAANRDGWDWDKWQKEDSKGLEALAASDKEAFDALYKAKYSN